MISFSYPAMNWLDTLLKKLPTIKGISWFFYVATHWSAFRDELELYRQQIRDRDEWRKTQTEIHEAEKQRIAHEAEQKTKAAMMAVPGKMRDRLEAEYRRQINNERRATQIAIHETGRTWQPY